MKEKMGLVGWLQSSRLRQSVTHHALKAKKKVMFKKWSIFY
nr:hypothetical protein [uncultured Marinifilum sp.]